MTRRTSISGFVEWLPSEKRREDSCLQIIRDTYELFGFTPIETPAVELVSTLAHEGEASKEVYGIHRLRGDESDKEAALGLHFDLTVPFARYVAEHQNELLFPFKRYQIQKVWRGERPQEGRFREFYQCDIDTIARDELPLSSDAEAIECVATAISKLGVGDYSVRLNHRRVLWGLYEMLGLSAEGISHAIIASDKIAKIGREGVIRELTTGRAETSVAVAELIVALADIRVEAPSIDKLRPTLEAILPSGTPLSTTVIQGIEDLVAIVSLLPAEIQGRTVCDLSIARGLGYYSGVIFETISTTYPTFGSICSGGRYDDLASRFTNHRLPGVGCSIGLTRLLALAFKAAIYPPLRPVPTLALVTVLDELQRHHALEIARQIRSFGVSTEVFARSARLGKQIEYADKRLIPWVLFLGGDGTIEAKDLRSKEQLPVTDLASWCSKVMHESGAE